MAQSISCCCRTGGARLKLIFTALEAHLSKSDPFEFYSIDEVVHAIRQADGPNSPPPPSFVAFRVKIEHGLFDDQSVPSLDRALVTYANTSKRYKRNINLGVRRRLSVFCRPCMTGVTLNRFAMQSRPCDGYLPQSLGYSLKSCLHDIKSSKSGVCFSFANKLYEEHFCVSTEAEMPFEVNHKRCWVKSVISVTNIIRGILSLTGFNEENAPENGKTLP